MNNYLTLIPVALLSPLVSVILYILEKRSKFGKLDYKTRQVIIGVIFGVIAILGTEFGVSFEGATINARDSAPLCAGLIFGAPAGIIAGLIGGIERWFAVYWGAGQYTRLSCSLSTIIAGLFAAMLRKCVYDNKKPSWFYGFINAFVVEVFHMLMIFITNMTDPHKAFAFVKECTDVMITVNSLSVMLAVLFISIIGKSKTKKKDKRYRTISQSFGAWLMAVVLLAFAFTSLFTYILQTNNSYSGCQSRLTNGINDVVSDIEGASDKNLLDITKRVAREIDAAGKADTALVNKIYGNNKKVFSEIHVIDKNGIIVASNIADNIGFDMSSGKQSSEFLVLNNGEKEFVQKYQAQSKDGAFMKYAGVALEKGGFVQIGYNSGFFIKDIDSRINGITENRHIGDNGFIIIAGENGRLVSAPEGIKTDNASLDSSIKPMTRFEYEIDGKPYCCMFTQAEGYYIVAAEPKEDVLFNRDLSVYVTVFMEVLGFASLFFVVYFLVKKLVVDNIHKINASLAKITKGNLNESVDIRTNEEFISLSDDINATVVALRGYIKEAESRIDKELEFARNIQFSALPQVFPPYPDRPEFDIYATMRTAKEVGGDFYDFFFAAEDKIAILIADVSGKGIPAALFMMKAKTLLKGLAETGKDIGEVFNEANEGLCEANEANMFVTAWMGLVNINTGEVNYVNAGHNPPVLIHNDGSVEYLKSRSGFILAAMETSKYRVNTLQLEKGDTLFLYTDGVTEAENVPKELYGENRLLKALTNSNVKSVREICETVSDDINEFVGEAPQFDDITMLSFRYNSKEQ
ncbi:MAG: SpoIIE family protein phosphatase [Clostridia bacterium]|nr:SpoIIE family protein phosphatase [Clostridia bacterium]